MKITLYVVGKLQERWLKEGCAEFAKRIGRFAQLDICELSEAPPSLPLSRQIENEGEALLKRLEKERPGFVVALALDGQKLSSEALAAELETWFELGGASVSFIIGGSSGLSSAVLARADARLSLGALTYPHQLARLLLLEQLFRCFKINRGETYHK